MTRPPFIPGPTGLFPKGKIDKHDEGQLNLLIGKRNDGKIIIEFGAPVKWIAFDREEAIQVALNILKKCDLEPDSPELPPLPEGDDDDAKGQTNN